jgi:hypothetical protein
MNARTHQGARGVLNRLDKIAAVVFVDQGKMMGRHDPRADVNDHRQPHALGFELLLGAERIANDELKP